MRAESFYNFATYVDQIASEDGVTLESYGGKSLHHQSHGESLLSLYANRFQKGLFIRDDQKQHCHHNANCSLCESCIS